MAAPLVCEKCDFDFDGGSGRCPACGYFAEPAQASAPESAGSALDQAEAPVGDAPVPAAEDSGSKVESAPDEPDAPPAVEAP